MKQWPKIQECVFRSGDDRRRPQPRLWIRLLLLCWRGHQSHYWDELPHHRLQAHIRLSRPEEEGASGPPHPPKHDEKGKLPTAAADAKPAGGAVPPETTRWALHTSAGRDSHHLQSVEKTTCDGRNYMLHLYISQVQNHSSYHITQPQPSTQWDAQSVGPQCEQTFLINTQQILFRSGFMSWSYKCKIK